MTDEPNWLPKLAVRGTVRLTGSDQRYNAVLWPNGRVQWRRDDSGPMAWATEQSTRESFEPREES